MLIPMMPVPRTCLIPGTSPMLVKLIQLRIPVGRAGQQDYANMQPVKIKLAVVVVRVDQHHQPVQQTQRRGVVCGIHQHLRSANVVLPGLMQHPQLLIQPIQQTQQNKRRVCLVPLVIQAHVHFVICRWMYYL